jgi:hypothetical protein
MFEKESKEYSDYVEYTHKRWGSDHPNYGDVETAYQKGAELAYNKANEWHYVKEGDLPKEDDVYLVYTTKGVLLGHYEQGGADGETNFKGEPYSDFTEYPSEMLFTEDEIIAWKEIVLPELKESE